MATKFHQISLSELYSDCQDMFIDDTPSFFQLLEQHFDISEFVPSVFYNAFYQSLGRKRLYPLTLSSRRFFPSLPIPCSSSFLPSAGN